MQRHIRLQKMAHGAQVLTGILKNFQIRAVKNMSFKFNPYSEKVRSIREVVFAMHSEKILSSNLNCVPKVEIKSDASEPEMKVDFLDGQIVLFKTQNLTTLDIVLKLNRMCMEKDPKMTDKNVIDTKSARKGKK